MAKRKRSAPKPKVTFEGACRLVGTALESRGAILAGVRASGRYDEALLKLLDGLGAHVFSAQGREISLKRTVNQLDRRTQDDGFHVLNDWDGKADQFNEKTIPVDVAAFMVGRPISNGPESEATVLAILLDYYFLYVIALLALRAWEHGDVNDNLEEITRLLGELQGRGGSGQRFVDDAETLIIVATAHYESDDQAYVRLLEKVKRLNESHRLRMALSFAAILGSHLRFGFEITYGRDMVALRNDNFPDYPWLSFSLHTLMEVYARMREEGLEELDGTGIPQVAGALVNGLSPDPRAFVGAPPESLRGLEREVDRFKELLARHREELVAEFEGHKPSEARYSPIAFYFNFVHNVLKGTVVDAMSRGRPWRLSLNALLTGSASEPTGEESPERLARTLMGYASRSPDIIRGRPVPVIIYDPRWGAKAVANVIQKTCE